jgi:hypothetical protein
MRAKTTDFNRLFDCQTRLNAAKATLSLAPKAARQQIEHIAASGHFPQAGDAGMCLWTLDQGIFNPQ